MEAVSEKVENGAISEPFSRVGCAAQNNDNTYQCEQKLVVDLAENLKLKPNDNTRIPTARAARQDAADGGWGWVIVVVAFFVQITMGIAIMSFGIIYVDLVAAFGGRSGPVGWIGSVLAFVGHVCSVPVSIAIDMYGCRVVSFIAGLLLSAGFFLSSFATNGAMMLTMYGILGGVGYGAVYLCCIVIIQQYFDRHRALAAGLASAGLSVGALIAGPLLQYLIDNYDWRGTLIIEAAIFLHIPILALLFRPIKQIDEPFFAKVTTDPHRESSAVRFGHQLKDKLGDMSIIRDVRFIMICASGFLTPMSFAAFMAHTPRRAVFCGIERHMASMLPSVIGSAALVSRILSGCLANLTYVNRLLVYSLSAISMCVLVMLSTLATTLPWIAVSCVVFGITGGCFTTVQPPSLVDLVGINKFPRAQGIFMIFFGSASLVATPLVGYIVDTTSDYSAGFLVVASCGLVGGALSIVVSLLDIFHKR